MSKETRVTQGYELPLKLSSFLGSAAEFHTVGEYSNSHLTSVKYNINKLSW